MKKIILLITFTILYCVSYSQTGYGGFIYDSKSSFTHVRPYIFTKLNESRLIKKLTYSPIIGMGINTIGSTSIQFGFDLYRPISKNKDVRVLMGFGVELLGWVDVYQEYMPNLRLGLEGKRFILLGTTNYTFKSVFHEGVWGYEPNMKPTFGLFYKINQ